MISFADQLRQLQRQGLRRGTDDDAAKRAAKPAQVGRAGKDAKSVSRAPVGRDRTVPGERSSKDLTNAKKKSSAPLKAKAGAVAGMKRKRGDEDGGRLASNSKSRQAKKDSFFEADEMDVRPNSSKAWGGLDDDEEESEGGLGWDDNDGSDEDGSSSEEDKEASDSESDGSDDGRGKKSTGNSNKASASAKGKGKLEPPKDKNRPAELSAKRAVGRARQVVPPSERKSRDPRFDDRTGSYNEGLFSRSYGFVFDLQKQEMSELRKRLSKEKNPDERKRLEGLLSTMQSKLRAKKIQEDRQKIKREWRKKQMERVKEGKKAFYLKEADIKRIELMEKFRKTNPKDLDKKLEKRRKKNATKDHRRMPFARQHGDGGN